MEDWCTRTKSAPLKGIKPTDEIIWLAAGETILAHTREYIGGRGNVTTMMKARSSLGRNFIEVAEAILTHIHSINILGTFYQGLQVRWMGRCWVCQSLDYGDYE